MTSINPKKYFIHWIERFSQSWLETWLDRLAWLFILLFLISGVLNLPRYGLSWDEGTGAVFFGERYYLYLTSFQEKFLDFRTDLDATSHLPLDLSVSPERNQPDLYPPLADTVSSASMHLLAYRLHWMDPVEAFHLPKIILSALFLWTFYRFFSKRAGRPVAFLGLLFLGTFPRFYGDMHLNPKDIPEAIFFSWTLMAYVCWYERPQWRKALLIGILAAGALAIKANAVFLPFFILLGVWQWDLRHPKAWLKHIIHLRNYFFQYLLMGCAMLLVYYLSWPYIYKNPLRALVYFKLTSSQAGHTTINAWNWQPVLQVLTTTPEIMLVFLGLGLAVTLVYAWKKWALVWRLVLVWFLIPIIRISLPGMANFDGIRHFLEFLPAAAILAGIGMAQLVSWLGGKDLKRRLSVTIILVTLLGVNIAEIMVRYYPYEYLYYNHLVGGAFGAEKTFGTDETGDYWAVSYREGISWLNRHAGSNAKLSVPIASYLVQETRGVWLRPDIELLPDKTDFDSLGNDEVYVMFILRPSFYTSLCQEMLESGEPVYQVMADGLPVMVIYQYPQK